MVTFHKKISKNSPYVFSKEHRMLAHNKHYHPIKHARPLSSSSLIFEAHLAVCLVRKNFCKKITVADCSIFVVIW
jgi:hypothetical protein